MQGHTPVRQPIQLTQPLVLLAVVAGGLNLALGLTVLVGWHMHSHMLVHIFPDFAPMSYHAALGFLLCGSGLLLRSAGQLRWTAVCGTGAAVISLPALLQYALGGELGIRPLPFLPDGMANLLQSGRMAPNTALNFLLSGGALLLLRRSSPSPRALLLGMCLGLAVLVLGVLAFLGYLASLTTIYRWRQAPPMSIHGAAGSVVLGIGIVAYIWDQARANVPEVARYFPLLVGVSVAALAYALGLALQTQERTFRQRMVASQAVSIQAEMVEKLANRMTTLVRLASFWEARRQTPDRWEGEMALSMQHDPSLYALVWVDPTWQVRWLAPRPEHDPAPDLPLADESRHRQALEQARSTRAATVVQDPGLWPGSKALFVYVPLFQDGTLGGVLAGVFGIHTLFNTILDTISPDLGLTIFDREETLYSRGQSNSPHLDTWDQEMPLGLADVTWRVRFWPLAESVATERSTLLAGVVTLGLLLAALLALVLHFAQTTWRQARQLARTNTELRDEMAEHQQAEERLRHQQEALYQQEKLASMGILLASVAHELNNPLSVVMMQTDLLCEELEDQPLAEHATEINRAAERCVRIVHNFLALARQHPPQRAPVQLNAVVEEVMALLAHACQMDNIDVCLHLAADLPGLWADPHQLHQVVVNLVTNAQQALGETSAPRRLTLTTQADLTQSMVSLEVADSGPGILPEVRRRIFEPFFTTKPVDIGTGLGLSLCQGMIESHGGTIGVTSQPGHDTVFRVELPVEAAPVSVALLNEAPATLPVQAKTVLVVDDEASIARAVAALLRRDRHQVDTAANGRLALAKLQEQTYDLILCDMRMPELDGPGLYRELEVQAPHLLRRFIFLTGDTLSPEGETFLNQAGVPRLVKPCKGAEVRRAVRYALQTLQAEASGSGVPGQEDLRSSTS